VSLNDIPHCENNVLFKVLSEPIPPQSLRPSFDDEDAVLNFRKGAFMADTRIKKTLAQSMVIANAKVQAIQEAAEQAVEATPVKMFLPGLDEFMRAMPNHIARSSLFAPVAPGRKKMHDGTILASRVDAVIRFKGTQLDESQADVWLQAMYEASKQPLGEAFIIQRAAFLRSMGRAPSGQNYQWLRRAMEDLSFAMLVIEVKKDGKTKFPIGQTRAIHMVEGFDYDEETEAYTLRIDPRWRGMYGNREYALIDWEKRMQFGQHQNMAKALQRLIATSSDPVQRNALDYLKKKMEYSSPMRKFKETLSSAMRELERLEIIAGGRIEVSTKGEEQTVWTKL
jgi:hypothetical protein